MNPGLPVMVLGGEFEPGLIQLAFRSGLHLIVNDGDIEALATSIAEQLDPVSAHL
jgi:hypothetical protein